jgi:hypothetical protein
MELIALITLTITSFIFFSWFGVFILYLSILIIAGQELLD